jgi:Xaa-Pro aminopeptidase
MHETRIGRLLARMEELGLDALLINSLPNVFYLSAFTGTNASLLITPRARWFITDFRYHERFAAEARGGWQLHDSAAGLARCIGGLCVPAARLGFEAEQTSVAARERLAACGCELVPTRNLVEELRAVKDSGEIETIRRAVALGEQVFGELLPCIRGGAMEREVAAEIEYRARRLGATECSFKPIIASGRRSAQPHAGFTEQRIQPGQPLTIDMGVVLAGYCSDMTRTVFPGDCPARWRELYAIVLEAKRRGFAASRAGDSGAAADGAAREYITERGYAENFGHGLGHGVGIQIHEAPRLVWTEKRLLAAGNVVSCEPGIYLPGEGGIRIEDMTLVTEDGPQNLNSLSDELMVV